MRYMFIAMLSVLIGCESHKVQDYRISSIVRLGTVKFVDVDAGITCYTVSDGTGVGVSCVR